jgi:redox-sensitive bicupin YhaK (pirin superfamily)
MAGEPINEPLVSYGPFVMNSKTEIIQAIHDYENGLMGSI